MSRAVAVCALLAFVSSAGAGTCPLTRVRPKVPRMVAVKSEKAARGVLLKGSTNMENEGDVLEAAQTQEAFAVDVRRRWEEGGDSSYWDTSVVFVLGTTFVIVPRVARYAVVLPPHCRYPRAESVVETRIVRTAHRTLGVYRVKTSTRDAATLPAQAGTRTDDCQDRATFRIEDHVIDLDRRRELAVVAGVYEGPLFEELAPPLALPSLDDRGATYDLASCSAIGW
jgi:hypothetical protein